MHEEVHIRGFMNEVDFSNDYHITFENLYKIVFCYHSVTSACGIYLISKVCPPPHEFSVNPFSPSVPVWGRLEKNLILI